MGLESREGRIREIRTLDHPSEEALRKYQIFDTHDVGVAQSAASRLMTPHRLRVRAPQFRGRMCAMPVGSSVVLLVDYSDEAELEHLETMDYYTVIVPLRGGTTVQGANRLTAGPGDICIVPPGPSLVLRYHAGCSLLGVRIPRQTVLRSFTVLTGQRADTLSQSSSLLADASARTPLLGALHLVLTTAHSASTGFARAVGEHLEQSLLTALILGHCGVGIPAKPRMVPAQRLGADTIHQVAQLLADRYAEPLSIAEIADMAGMSTRRLQVGFQRLYGVSPGTYRLNLRLQRAHEELLAASPDTTVADIAAQCGFVNGGRFSRAYRIVYGTTPSVTLHG